MMEQFGKLRPFAEFLYRYGMESCVGLCICAPIVHDGVLLLAVSFALIPRMAQIMGLAASIDEIMSARTHALQLVAGKNPFGVRGKTLYYDARQIIEYWRELVDRPYSIPCQRNNLRLPQRSNGAGMQWRYPIARGDLDDRALSCVIELMGGTRLSYTHVGFGWKATGMFMRPPSWVYHDECQKRCRVSLLEFKFHEPVPGPPTSMERITEQMREELDLLQDGRDTSAQASILSTVLTSAREDD